MIIDDDKKKLILNSLNQIIDLINDTDFSKVYVDEDIYKHSIIEPIHYLYQHFDNWHFWGKIENKE